MKRFKTHKLLSESFLTRPLGLSSPQNMGLVSSRPGVAEDIHMKMPVDQGDDSDDDDMLMKRDDDMDDDGDEDGDDSDLDMHDDDDLDAAEDGDDSDDMDDADDDMDDDDGMPMGKPHDNSAYMGEAKKSKSKKMKGDLKIQDDEEDEEDEKEEGDGKMDHEDDDDMCGCKKMKSGDKKKKCSGDMSMKKMKETAAPQKSLTKWADYLPPTSALLKNKDFLSRVAEGYAVSPSQKNFSGLTENDRVEGENDGFKEPQPGEVGYAPATRIGQQKEVQNLNETVADLTRRLRRLEKIVSRIS